MNRMLDQDEIASRFGIARQTLGRWVEEGRFPPATNNRRRGKLWDEAVVDTFERNRDAICFGLDFLGAIIRGPAVDAEIRTLIAACVEVLENLTLSWAIRVRCVEVVMGLLNANSSPRLRSKFRRSVEKLTGVLEGICKQKNAADELTSELDSVAERYGDPRPAGR